MRSIDVILLEGIRAGQFGGESKSHGDHAMGFVRFSDDAEADFRGHVVDIGSGAGLPALVLADAFPQTTWSLIERRRGRTELLTRAVHRLGLDNRVEVIAADVAVAAHGPLRAQADWVTARSFGPPGDTAECGSAFLRPGGSLLYLNLSMESFMSDGQRRAWRVQDCLIWSLGRQSLDGMPVSKGPEAMSRHFLAKVLERNCSFEKFYCFT